MEIKIDKKFFITLGIALCLCVASFCAGRFFRYRAVEHAAEQRIDNIKSELERIKSERDELLVKCTELEEQIGTTESRIDDCLGIIGQLRLTDNESANAIGTARTLVTELRNRVENYETRIAELEEHLRRAKESSQFQQY